MTRKNSVDRFEKHSDRLDFLGEVAPFVMFELDAEFRVTSAGGTLLNDCFDRESDVLGLRIDDFICFKSSCESVELQNMIGVKNSCIVNDVDFIMELKSDENGGGSYFCVCYPDTSFFKKFGLKSYDIKHAIDKLNSGICIVGNDFNIRYFNEEFYKYFPMASVGDSSICFGDPSVVIKGDLSAVRLTYEDGLSRSIKLNINCGDEERYFHLNVSAVVGSSGKILNIVENYKDITDSVRREDLLKSKHNELMELNRVKDQRVQEEVSRNMENSRIMFTQSRLAAMGEMIGNIAHQWRQPLNNIALTMHEMKYDFESSELDEETLSNYVERIENIVCRMSDTIDDFRNFFNKEKEKTVFRLIDTIAETLGLVDASYSTNNIGIGVYCDRDIYIEGHPNEFSQVLLNLLGNSKDAVLESEAESPFINITVYEKNERAYVQIEDNGGGIDSGIIDRVFEPYFTTKEEGKGTGIGLYMSKMIIENSMGGELTAENIEHGARFTIIISTQ